MSLKTQLRGIIAEIDAVLQEVSEKEVDQLVKAIMSADRVFVHSLGREGLVLKAFAMRLAHLGLRVHVVGDMTTPNITKSDLFIISTGPGNTPSVLTLAEIAKESGATVALITAHPEGKGGQIADIIVEVGGQTMAEDETAKSIQPMGSTHEQAELILLDCVILRLRDELGETDITMAGRHTNLE